MKFILRSHINYSIGFQQKYEFRPAVIHPDILLPVFEINPQWTQEAFMNGAKIFNCASNSTNIK